LSGNRLLYRDGIPTAVLAAGDIQFLETLDTATEWTAQKALLRGPSHAPSISPNADGQVDGCEPAASGVLLGPSAVVAAGSGRRRDYPPDLGAVGVSDVPRSTIW
jgi:hypothetical protein